MILQRPGQNKYRYQLVGIDNDWVESDNRRSATYLHLPSGNYAFKVQGTNSQGVWSEKITELQIQCIATLVAQLVGLRILCIVDWFVYLGLC